MSQSTVRQLFACLIIYSVLFQSFLFAVPQVQASPQTNDSSANASTLQGLTDRVSGFFGADYDVTEQAADLTVTAFGPKKFTRTQGAPNNYVETFTLPTACAGGTYKIVVENGEQVGTNRISSAEIKLNSVPLLIENDFNQNTYQYEKPVTLAAENTLEIRLASPPHSYVTIEIVGENCGPVDTVPPRLVVSTPEDNKATSGQTIAITGTAEDLGGEPSGIAQVLVNNTAVSYDPVTKAWATSSYSLAVGTNIVTVRAIDNAGNESTSQVTIIRDVTNPTVAISSPTSGSVTLNASVTISGTSSDGGTDASGVARVTVNGVEATLNLISGEWTIADVALTVGSNTINVVAYDRAGNQSTSQVTLTRVVNQAPVANAGSDQTIVLPNTASLSGTAPDDEHPSNSVSVSWTKVSGEGDVAFSNPGSLNTSASFSTAGTYVLRLSASDGLLSDTDDVTVTVHPVNQAPVVSTGADQTIELPNSAILAGSATDDGYPVGSNLQIQWSTVSGPGQVSFSNASSATGNATFTVPGAYVLRLTASDGTLSSSDDLTITVNPQNAAPTVDAGPAQAVEMPNTITLSGSATDDGLPTGSTLTYAWLKVSGDGDVAFSHPNSASTQVSFTQAGTYTLRLNVSDGLLMSSDDVAVVVIPQNGAPVANAGTDQTVVLPNVANIVGSATDDGSPTGSSLTYAWTKLAGDGVVTFGSPNAASTSAVFTQPGSYTLRLSVSDGALSSVDDVNINVLPANQAPTVNAGSDRAVELPNAVDLTGTVTDDGYPMGSTLAILWTAVSGPGAVNFSTPSQVNTGATFGSAGLYVLRLTATDGELTTTDEVTITVDEANQPPTVNAGSALTIQLPATAALAGSASDDGRPAGGTLVTIWTKISGPGEVTFADASLLITTASFTLPGTYEIGLEASDGTLSVTDSLLVTVAPQGGQPVAGYIVPSDGGPLEMSVQSFSSFSSATFHPNALLDDSRFTDWRSATNQVTNQFIKFRITADDQLVERFRLQQGNASTGAMVKDFAIQVSNATDSDADFVTVVSGTLASNDAVQEFVLPNGPIVAKFVKVVVVSRHGTSTQVVLGTVQAVGAGNADNIVSLPGTTNVARSDSPSLLRNGATVTRFSSFDVPAIGVINGSVWRTKGKTDEFVVIKLAGDESHLLRGIRINPFYADYQNYWVRDFEVWVSNTVDEDQAFTQVLVGSKNTFDNQDYTFPGGSVQARYLKFVPKTSAQTAFIGVPVIEALTVDSRGVDSYSPGYAGSTFENAFFADSTGISCYANDWLKFRVAPDLEKIVGMRVEGDNNWVYGFFGPKDYAISISTTTAADSAFTIIHTGTLTQSNAIQEVRFAQPTNARFVKVHWLTGQTAGRITVRRLELLAHPSDGAVITSISTSGDNFSPARMLDLDQEQRAPGWTSVSGQTTNQQATILLHGGEVFDVDHVSIRPGMPLVFGTYRADASPRDFDIQVSSTDDADTSFTTVYSGTMSSVNRMQHFYFQSTPARYVRLLIRNNYGYSVVSINTILVYAKDTGPQDVVFYEHSSDPDGDIVAYEWDFGDGLTSPDRNPQHTFATPGNYDVSLTVTDASGLTSTVIRPYRALPTLKADFLYTPTLPVETDSSNYSAHFADLSSSRLTSTLSPVYLEVKNYPYQFQARGQFSTTFSDNGIYPAILRVGSEYTLNYVTTKNINVENLPPIVEIADGKTVYWGESWTNTVKTLSDPAPADRSTLQGRWLFGDGGTSTCSTCSIATAQGAYTYSLPGSYTATLTITDKDGGSTSDSADFVVLKHPTKVAFGSITRNGSELSLSGTLSDTWANVVLGGKPLSINVNGSSLAVTTDPTGNFAIQVPIDPAAQIGNITTYFDEDAMYQASSNVYSAMPDRTLPPAESPQNGGTDFWLAFPINASYRPPDGFNAFPPVAVLMISSQVSTTGTAIASGCGLNTTFSVTPGTVTRINVPYACQVKSQDQIANLGIRVTSQHPVVVYGMNENFYTSDGYLGLPAHTLGTEYIGLTYGNEYGYIAGSQLVAVATQNSTAVTITPSVSVGTRLQGIPYQITLNQGQTYSLTSTEFGVTKDLTGTRITSDKPIAVFGGQEATAVPGSIGCCADHLVEQMAPVNTWGKRFVLIPTATRTKGDFFRVVASQDATSVYIGGSRVAILNRGQKHEQLINNSTELIATAPVMVGQYATGAGYDSSTYGADPFMAIVPPYSQYLGHYTVSTTNRLNSYVNISVPTTAVGQITLDGTAIAAASFSAIPATGFSTARVPLPIGAHTLTAQVPFGLLMYGYGNTEGYGYPGGMGLVPTVHATNLEITPETSAYGINSQACVNTRLFDQDNIPLGGRVIAISVSGANSATANGTTNASGHYEFCYSGTNVGTDIVTATHGTNSTTASVIWSPPNQAPTVGAGDDQSITLPTQATLAGTANDDGYPNNSLVAAWAKTSGPGEAAFANANSLSTTVSFTLPGSYVLTLSVSDGQFTTSDSMTVTVIPEAQNFAPSVSAGDDGSATMAANLVSNPGAELDLVEGSIPNWTEVSGTTATRVEGGVNNIPAARLGTHVFSAGSDSATELYQDIDVRGFAVGIAAGTQEFTVRAYVRSLAENTPDSGRIVFEYRDATNQNVIATLNSGDITSTNAWHETEDTRVPPTGTGFVRVRLIATRNSGDTNDVYFDAVSLKPSGNVAAVKLAGTAGDDGLPTGNALTTTWTKVTGDGNVTFEDAASPGSGVTFEAPGTYVLRLTATDGSLSTNDDVTITVADVNQAPVVNAGADQSITLPLFGTLAGTATDDSGLTPHVRWEKVSGAGIVSFADPRGLNSTVSFTAAGTYVLRLTAEDGELEASDDITINVIPIPATPTPTPTPVNQAPTVNAGDNQTIQLPVNSVALTGTVTDDGLPNNTLTIGWSKRAGDGNVAFANPVSAQTTAAFDTAGSYVLRLTVSDGQYTAWEEIVVTVNPAGGGGGQNQPPVVNAGPDQTVPGSHTAIFESLSIVDDGLPIGANYTSQWSKVSGDGNVTFSNRNETATYATFSQTGVYVIRFTVSDSELSGSDDITVTVVESQPGPSVEILTPSDGAGITAPASITGSVSGGEWKIEYSLADTDNPVGRVWSQFGNGSGAASGDLATLDTTLMLNGLYDVRLSTTDQYGQISTDTISLSVENNLKVGHFTVSFDDMNVPVRGLPMQIVRTYDSRDKRTGDFGIGWTLSIKNIRVEKNRTIGLNWRQTSNGALFPTYCVEATRPHIVTVTMPDGTVEKFNAKLRKMCQQYAPVDYSYVDFEPEAGTRGKLEIVGDNYVAVVGSVPGPMEFVGFNGQGIFDSASFKYTAKDGTQFTLRQGVGLEQVRDLDGNTLTITPNGIQHSTGVGISFTRDTFGRITNVTDPEGEANVYEYDAAGDLISFTDREENETTFTYEPTIPHHLKSIVDPLGRTPIRNDYDASGRLLKHTDAEGNEIVYTHDLAARIETVTDRLGNPTVYEYDGRGNVLRKRDALEHETTYSYDGNDNMLTETNALGKTTTYTYDLFDNRTSVTNPLGNRTEFTYNNLGQPLTVKDARGRITTNTYSPSGQLLTVTDPLGRTTTNVYSLQTGLQTRMRDAYQHETQYEYTNNRLTAETNPQGNVTTYGYDANGNRDTQTVRRTNALGQVETITTTFLYDKLNRLTKTTYADGSFTQIEYNELGQQKATIDQAGHRTEFEYDTLGRLIKTTYPDGKFEESTYDDEGRRLTSKDRAGRVTTFEYDVVGRLKKTIYPDSTFTLTNYDAAGQVLTSTDARNNVTTFTYDDAGRRLTVKNALDQVTSFAYDANGNQTSMTDARNDSTGYVFDDLNRRTRTNFADASFTETTYDKLGRRIAEKDQAGKVTQFVYDSIGRMTKVIDALEQETRYEYNEIGQQTNQIDALNRETKYEYDKLGRRTKRILPLGQVETYTYNTAGNLETRTDFNRKTTTFGYDNMRRLLSKTPDPSLSQPAVTFTYNDLGQRETMTDASGVTNYVYDNRNRLASKQTPFGTLSYTYNSLGNVETLRSSNANGVSVDYAYDELNRLEGVTDNRLAAGSNATTYTYDAVGNLESYTYPNQVTTGYAYNNLNRLTGMTVGNGQTNLAGYAYTLGAAGNRTQVVEASGRTVNYVYDDLYRLTRETISNSSSGGQLDYQYDAVGNRLNRTSTVSQISNQTPTYDNNDRLNSDGFDENGNTRSSNSKTYNYDFENRLTSTSDGVTIVYDGDGNRVAKTAGGVTTFYLVDTNNLTGYAQVVEELQSGVGVTKSYTYGHDLISQRQGAAISFYSYDGHGSVRQLTNASGSVTDTYAYDAFGNLISRTGTTDNNYLYAGEQFDPDLGFYYNRARYMNVETGRFASMDRYEGNPSDPISLHKYLYANNDPANMTDPSGNIPLPFPVSFIVGRLVDEHIRTDFILRNPGTRRGNIGVSTILQERGISTGIIGVAGTLLRPDLIDYSPDPGTGLRPVYEIKTIRQFSVGVTQLGLYLGVLNAYDPGWGPGMSYTPPSSFVVSSFGVAYNITTTGPRLGVITYDANPIISPQLVGLALVGASAAMGLYLANGIQLVGARRGFA